MSTIGKCDLKDTANSKMKCKKTKGADTNVSEKHKNVEVSTIESEESYADNFSEKYDEDIRMMSVLEI